MAGTSGRKAQVKVTGGGVAFTHEAMFDTNSPTVGPRAVYQITDSTKNCWDPNAAITIEESSDGGATWVAPTGTYHLIRLAGMVRFDIARTAGHLIRASGTYLPLSVAAECKDFNYSSISEMLEDNSFGDTDVTRLQGLTDIQGTLGRWWSTDTYFTDALLAALPVVIEFSSNSAAAFDRRVWALLNHDQVQAQVRGQPITEDVSFMGTPDVDGNVAAHAIL